MFSTKDWTCSYWRRQLCPAKISSSALSRLMIPLWSEPSNPVNMSPIRRTCQFLGCGLGMDGGAYKMMENLASQELVLEDMQLHVLVHLARVSAAATRLQGQSLFDPLWGCMNRLLEKTTKVEATEAEATEDTMATDATEVDTTCQLQRVG